MTIKQFQDKYRPLSNFWIVRAGVYLPTDYTPEVHMIKYPTVEHAYQAAKSLEYVDYVAIGRIPAREAGQSKAYGETIQIRPNWESIKQDVMYHLLQQKFKQPDLRDLLLSTGDQLLQEGNKWRDTYWGVDLTTGKGENHLGKLLMRVRKELTQ